VVASHLISLDVDEKGAGQFQVMQDENDHNFSLPPLII